MFGYKRSNSLKFIGVLMLLAALFANTKAQNIQFSQGKVEEAMSNSLAVALMNYKGRGINLPVTLNYSSNVWRIDNINTVCGNPCSNYETMTQAIYAEHSTAGWKSSLDLPKIEFPKTTDTYYVTGGEYCYVCGSGAAQFRVARLYVHMPDGSTHELRKSDARYSGSIDMSGTFYAVDGSRLRYDGTDADTGTLYLPDGTRYVLDAGSAQLIDRHGNTLYYNGTNRQWTDTLGRVIGMPIPANPQAQDYTYNLPGLAGVNNGLQTYTFKWRELEDALTPNENNNTPALRVMADYYLLNPNSEPTAENGNNYPQPQTSDSLFRSSESKVVGKGQSQGQRFNPIVLAEIVLPDGSTYKFSYNIYGEIDKVTYPTGAYEKYKIEEIVGSWNLSEPYNQANRGITNRKLSINGTGNDLLEWKYRKEEVGVGAWGGGADLYKVIAPDNTRTEVYKLKIPAPMHGSPHYREYWDFGFVEAKNGATVEKRVYSTTDGGWTGGTLHRRELTEYERTTAYQMTLPNNWVVYAYRNLRAVKNVNIIFEGSGAALAQTTTFSYDTTHQMTTGVDKTQTNIYHYAVVNNASSGDTAQSGTINQIPIGNLSTSTETTYVSDSTYRNANILGLPTVVKVRDSAGIVSQSETLYDESGYSPAIGRGLATSTKVWDSTKGLVTNPAAYLVVRATFDAYGNQTIATDARGNSTTTAFDSTYHAFPVSVTTAAPDQNGGTHGSTTGLTTSIAYDTSTPPLGLPVSQTDSNGKITSMEYNDALLRQTKVIAPNGHQTITSYGVPDANTGQIPAEQRFVKVKSQIDETNWSEAYTWFDAIGRTIVTQKVDSNGDIFTKTKFDHMGRMKKISNPFRGENTPDEQLEWTENFYDDLSRVTKVKTADSAETQTIYALATSGDQIGTAIIVKDAALREKRSITNGLGQLIRLDEPNNNGQLGTIQSPNQATVYSYDSLNNLTTVVQGEQTRTFVYDSLSRLLSATNPETGIIQYTYNANGAVQTKRDSRGIKTVYDYDALNRIIKKCYRVVGTGSLGMTTCANNNEAVEPNTLDVTYNYDAANVANSKGQLTKVTTGNPQNPFSTTEYLEFDNLGKIKRSRQTTDNFSTGESTYTYNLSGGLIEQTYPSGRVVRNVLNADGELSIVRSKKNENAGFWNYAQHFTYSPVGAVSSLQLGNGRWESTVFNSRLQPIRMALGATENATDLLKLEYSYGTWENGTLNEQKNNGNVARQIITVPTVGNNSGFTATQVYTYDSLNRIKQATETIPNQTGWQQVFNYDRYGNRTFDESNTSTLRKNCGTAPNLTVCPADIPLVNPSAGTDDNRLDGYVYDNTGNVTRDAENRKFTYDAENKQVKVETVDSNGNVIDTIGRYYYDGNGKRVKKYVPAAQETTLFIYDASDRLIGEYSTLTPEIPKVSYLTSDYLGSPRINTDEYGDVMAQHDYQPFGEEINRVNYGGDDVRKQFTGYERDKEIDLDFAQARMYSKNHARFTTPDPLQASANSIRPQSWNRYSYSYNNPLRFTDPSGMIAGDFYNLDGRKIGTDGIDDDKIHIVYDEQKAEEIKKTKGNYTGTVTGKVTIANADVIKEIGEAVERSNSPTIDDKEGGFHEEAVYWKTENGNTTINNARGAYGNPKLVGEVGVNIPADVDGKAHIHPSGEVVENIGGSKNSSSSPGITIGGGGTTNTYFFNQPPSNIRNADGTYRGDLANALPNGTNIVVGARNETVYFYKASGNQTTGSNPCNCIAKMKLSNFLKIGK